MFIIFAVKQLALQAVEVILPCVFIRLSIFPVGFLYGRVMCDFPSFCTVRVLTAVMFCSYAMFRFNAYRAQRRVQSMIARGEERPPNPSQAEVESQKPQYER